MGFNFNIGYNSNRLPNYIERNNDGSMWYSIIDAFIGGKRKGFKSESNKLETILSNPAILKVFCFLADTYSQVKINQYSNDKLKEKDFLYSYQKTPNDWQTWTDLFWEHRFWLASGNAYLYVDANVWYYLRPQGLDFTDAQIKAFSQLTFSSKNKRDLLKGTFKYRNENGKVQENLKFENLHVFTDMSGGISGNWLKGNSRLDALYQIAVNSDLALRSKGTNLKYTEKFLVSGQHDAKDTSSRPMVETEKESIEQSLENGRKINATKSKVDMQQMVSNLAQLELDQAYESDLIKVANMYGIPKDVIDILSKGSTYENQEKSLGKFINYNEMPKVQQMTDTYEVILLEEDLRGSFKHLPFNSVFEVDKITNRKTELESLKIAIELGLDAKVVETKLKQIYEY
jgi:hypothetical protein